jgi:hypothetical protein
LMYDNHSGENRRGSRASLGAVPALHIYCGYVTRHLERLEFTDPRHPEVVADRGRRPHVPSSKPTMSKSRRVFLPLEPGQPGYRLRRRNGVGQTPCPAGGGHIWAANPPVNGFFQRFFRRSGGRRTGAGTAEGAEEDPAEKAAPRLDQDKRQQPLFKAWRTRFSKKSAGWPRRQRAVPTGSAHLATPDRPINPLDTDSLPHRPKDGVNPRPL